ncbi:MAG: hypothetical protein JSR67_12930 [Proteobacteria bacterium]|nr:hypothetical protein [Pseudomonadota bacterium]
MSTQQTYAEVLRAEQRRCDEHASELARLIVRDLERAEEIDRLLAAYPQQHYGANVSHDRCARRGRVGGTS